MIITLWNGQQVVCKKLIRGKDGHYFYTDTKTNMMIPVQLIKEIITIDKDEGDDK